MTNLESCRTKLNDPFRQEWSDGEVRYLLALVDAAEGMKEALEVLIRDGTASRFDKQTRDGERAVELYNAAKEGKSASTVESGGQLK